MYTLATKHSLDDVNRIIDRFYNHQDDILEAYTKEQDKTLKSEGITHFDNYTMRFFKDNTENTTRTEKECIYEAMQKLSIKEGVELVRLENNNLAYIAFYGSYVNGFEIVKEV